MAKRKEPAKRKPAKKTPAKDPAEAEASDREMLDYQAFGFPKLERDPHVRACLLCKAVLDQCAEAEDDDYMAEAYDLILSHIRAKKDNAHRANPCNYSGCIHHEEVSRSAALAMIRLGGGDKPWADVRGIKVSTVPLAISPKDMPSGLETGDIQMEYFENLKKSAGCIYLRLGPKKTEVHVWISPAYASRHEDIGDPATLSNVLQVFEKVVPAQMVWCLEKYTALKEFTQMSEEFGDKEDD